MWPNVYDMIIIEKKQYQIIVVITFTIVIITIAILIPPQECSSSAVFLEAHMYDMIII